MARKGKVIVINDDPKINNHLAKWLARMVYQFILVESV